MKALDYYISKIANYAFIATMIVMFSSFIMFTQIKNISEEPELAKSISLFTICQNYAWNFFFFVIHFQLSTQGELMQYLFLPTFWHFISSFIIESKLFILVWRAQLS